MNLCPDYRKFSLSKIMQPEYKHILLLLYWPVYGLFFLYFERIRVCEYHVVESSLDKLIPFCSWFIIPYFFWFVFLIGMLLYTFFFDVPTFKKYMWYIIITYSATIIIYFVYPTKQELRPMLMSSGGLFDRIVAGLYIFDTNTNVCPSIHVLGSMAVYFASLKCERFSSPWAKCAFLILAVLISVSTVFLKQHSAIDLITAVILGVICYPFVFCKNKFSDALMRIM